MDLRATIRAEHSKMMCSHVVKWIGSNQERFDELFRLFLDDEPVIQQRAAWPLSYAAGDHPPLIQKHFGKLLRNLKKNDLHDSIKRNTMRLLQYVPVPEKFHGEVMNIAFDYIISPSENPAIKAFSLSVLENLSKQYPEIKQELKTIIEDRWEIESAAFRSRAKRILKGYR